MARGIKKEKELTIEERLEQALVPVEEQPYSVPENWCWCKMYAICDFERGITFPASAKQKAETDSNIPCLRTTNIQENLDLSDLLYVEKKYTKENSAKMIQVGDIIMSSANSYELVGKTSYVADVPFPMTFGGFLIVIRSKIGYCKYLFYYMRYQFFMGKFMGESTQTTNIANINTAKIKKYSFPFPPFAEQQRIVDCIERLFSRLDETKEKAQAIIDGFETRKAAILHKAFTGELTAKWRKENKCPLETWKSVQFGELLSDVRLGLVKGKEEQSNDKKYAYFKMNNISMNGFIDYNFIRVNATEAEAKLYCLEDGDFLFNTRNSYELVGKNCVWHSKSNDCVLYNNNLMRIRFFKNIHPQYISYFFYSTKGQKELNKRKKNTTNIAAIYAKDLNRINIIIPSYNEQCEIVRILDIILNEERKAKETAEGVLDQIEIMKKSILARAFRGDLGTNDPTEESAVELLKKVL